MCEITFFYNLIISFRRERFPKQEKCSVHKSVHFVWLFKHIWTHFMLKIHDDSVQLGWLEIVCKCEDSSAFERYDHQTVKDIQKTHNMQNNTRASRKSAVWQRVYEKRSDQRKDLRRLYIDSCLDWRFLILASMSRWPAEYCSITSITSYGRKLSLNFRLDTMNFIMLRRERIHTHTLLLNTRNNFMTMMRINLAYFHTKIMCIVRFILNCSIFKFLKIM